MRHQLSSDSPVGSIAQHYCCSTVSFPKAMSERKKGEREERKKITNLMETSCERCEPGKIRTSLYVMNFENGVRT